MRSRARLRRAFASSSPLCAQILIGLLVAVFVLPAALLLLDDVEKAASRCLRACRARERPRAQRVSASMEGERARRRSSQGGAPSERVPVHAIDVLL
jgi:hypothetical protein